MEALAAALVGIALVLFIAEAHVPGGVFAGLGIASLVGAGFAFREAGNDLPIAVIVAAALVLGGFFIFAGRKVFKAHRDEPVRTGWEELVGREGEAREPLDPVGQIWVEGALWKARVGDGEPGLEAGARVLIESVDGLTLVVRPVSDVAGEPGQG
ncbi:MAG: NfeD family protein [Solirubrobacterales bacterium]